MKGIVLLCMIASHWVPHYLGRIGLDEGPVLMQKSVDIGPDETLVFVVDLIGVT